MSSIVLVLSGPGVLEMHSAKASGSNYLTAHPLGLSREGSRFRLCNLNQTNRLLLSDSSSNIVHSHRYLLRVGQRNVRSSTNDNALLRNVAIPDWLITIRSSETIISSRSCRLLSSGPPFHDLYLALKSPATTIGPGHCLMLSFKSSRSA